MPKRFLPLLLASAALTPAFAQDDPDVSENCLQLFSYADEDDRYDFREMPALLRIIERDDPRLCRSVMNLLRRDGPEAYLVVERRERALAVRDRERDQDRDEETVVDDDEAAVVVSETARAQETVTLTGEVDVRVPAPNIVVDQAAAEVTVRQPRQRVSINQSAPSITVREQAPTIRVGMPTIIIEQPAPVIEIVMPDPTVDLGDAQPRVEVTQPEPRVRVMMDEPEVNLDLRPAIGSADRPVRTRVRSAAASNFDGGEGARRLTGDQADGEAQVFVREAEPVVRRMRQGDGEPRIEVERGEPSVRLIRAEPNIEIDGEPEIDFRRTGEPRVTFRTRDEGQEMSVADLRGEDVYTPDGEEIGEIGRVVQLGNSVYAVLEHGGFFGLGTKEIPIPISELVMRDGELIALNLTEERVENLSEQELSDDLDLDDAQPLMIADEG